MSRSRAVSTSSTAPSTQPFPSADAPAAAAPAVESSPSKESEASKASEATVPAVQAEMADPTPTPAPPPAASSKVEAYDGPVDPPRTKSPESIADGASAAAETSKTTAEGASASVAPSVTARTPQPSRPSTPPIQSRPSTPPPATAQPPAEIQSTHSSTKPEQFERPISMSMTSVAESTSHTGTSSPRALSVRTTREDSLLPEHELSPIQEDERSAVDNKHVPFFGTTVVDEPLHAPAFPTETPYMGTTAQPMARVATDGTTPRGFPIAAATEALHDPWASAGDIRKGKDRAGNGTAVPPGYVSSDGYFTDAAPAATSPQPLADRCVQL